MNSKQKAALASIVAGFSLTTFKFIVGILTASLGIISEALHSLLDFVAAIITYISVSISDKPADQDHNYGHGKVENLSAFLESILLFVTSIWIIYEAVTKLMSGNALVEITIWSYVVVIISIVIDFTRSRKLLKEAKRNNSQALEADAIHFSTDILSSGCVLLGLIFANLGYHKADSIAAICVALIILYIAYGMSKKAVDVLLDKVPENVTGKVEELLNSRKEVIKYHDLKIRAAGANIFIKVNVHFLSELDLQTTHQLCDSIEAEIMKAIPNSDVTVHAEPDDACDN
jgi:cation diffusion facilitator family transporter